MFKNRRAVVRAFGIKHCTNQGIDLRDLLLVNIEFLCANIADEFAKLIMVFRATMIISTRVVTRFERNKIGVTFCTANFPFFLCFFTVFLWF